MRRSENPTEHQGCRTQESSDGREIDPETGEEDREKDAGESLEGRAVKTSIYEA